jgi:hypothetical protein
MKSRTGDATATARIVLAGLQGKPVAELCNEHQSSQRSYAQGRDPCLASASKTCEVPQDAHKEARLARENARLTLLVGELSLAVKPSDEGLGGAGNARPWSPSATMCVADACRRSRLSPPRPPQRGASPCPHTWGRTAGGL